LSSWITISKLPQIARNTEFHPTLTADLTPLQNPARDPVAVRSAKFTMQYLCGINGQLKDHDDYDTMFQEKTARGDPVNLLDLKLDQKTMKNSLCRSLHRQIVRTFQQTKTNAD